MRLVINGPFINAAVPMGDLNSTCVVCLRREGWLSSGLCFRIETSCCHVHLAGRPQLHYLH